MLRIIFVTVLGILLCGSSYAHSSKITKEQAVDIAKKAVINHPTGYSFSEVDINVNEGQSVLIDHQEPVWHVEFVPKKRPCMTFFVEVGQVTGKDSGVFTSRCAPQDTVYDKSQM